MKFQIIMTAFQLLMVVLYGVLFEYEESLGSLKSFGLFQNVQVMIFVGFGFLMTFMRRYGWGAVGFTFVFALVAMQFAPVLLGIFHHIFEGHSIGEKNRIDIMTLMNGEFCAGAVLITLGGVIGKVSPLQFLVVTLLESIFYSVNEVIVFSALGTVDAGGSTVIHAFGAYFGLALSFVIGNCGFTPETSHKNGLFSMIGTLFLWMYWPSFNAGPTEPGSAEQQRAIVNTVLSIGSSAVAAFVWSKTLRGGKFEMEDVQNATLAGGVAMGTSCTMRIHPAGALVVGYLAGMLSVNGYVFGAPLLRKFGICDTCGIHNLHGMPAVLAALVSAVVVATATADGYKDQASLEATFPGLAACAEDANSHTICGRSIGTQAGMQVAGLLVSMGFAIVGGLVTGVVVKADFFEPLKKEACFEDAESWNIEDGDEAKPSGPSAGQTPMTYV